MLNEFCSMTGAKEGVFEKMWCKHKGLVFKYAPLSQKKSVKHLIELYLSTENSDKGMFSYNHVYRCMLMVICIHVHLFIHTERTTAYVLDLLTAYLAMNKTSGQPLLSISEVSSSFMYALRNVIFCVCFVSI